MNFMFSSKPQIRDGSYLEDLMRQLQVYYAKKDKGDRYMIYVPQKGR